ncbi:MAG: alpha/beta hydrolase, partial [Spirochaetaceae bacterium]|nr:alpha/beta hydrolase [Spirochaetaceae bacterium]
ELEGYRFHGEVHGAIDSPVVIVLHGGPGGDYRSLLPLTALEDDYRIVFYDQRGSGLSPRVPDEELTLDRYIADVDLFVERFSPDSRVRIIGHSWGAMLASAYIGRHQDKVAAAVLAEPGFLDEEHRQVFEEMTGLSDLEPSPRVIAALAAYYPDDDLENAVGDSWRFGAAASAAIPGSGIDKNGRLIDLAAGVETWSGKALFVSGSENSIIGPDYQAEQMSRFPHAQLSVVEGAGHTMIGEKPTESLAIIRRFLAD